jgi:hypothetical protein
MANAPGTLSYDQATTVADTAAKLFDQSWDVVPFGGGWTAVWTDPQGSE